MSSEIGKATKEVDYEKDIDRESIKTRMMVTRYKLLDKQPFYGTLAINLRLKMVDSNSPIKTAGVDGTNFFYNPHFIDALDDEELVFLIAHEVMHCVLRHMTRRGKRDHTLFNQAGDYIINFMLVRDNVGKFPSVGGLYNEEYGNMVSEELYQILKDNQENGGGSGGGGSGGSGSNGPGDGGNFDEHIEIEISDGDEDGEGQGDGSSKSVSMSENQAAELENDMVSSIIQAADNARKAGAGKVPAEIERLISDFTEPKMNWRDIVRETAKSQVTSDYTWKRPNRKFMSSGIILPSMTVDDHFDFVVGIDASGSMGNEQLRDFLSEIYGIADAFMSFKIGVFTFDTKVYNFQEFDQNTIDELLEYNPKGGGGTDFMCCWEYFKEHDITPETFIMLTDGMPWNSWGDEDYCETVFLIHDQYAIAQNVRAPFGTTLYYDDFEA